MKYQSCISSDLKVIAKVKVFKNRSKTLVPRKWSLTRNIHVQYESPISSGLKVKTKVKFFFKNRPNFKVKVMKSKPPYERSCHKKYTCEIPILNGWKVMAKVKVFVYATNADVDIRAMT